MLISEDRKLIPESRANVKDIPRHMVKGYLSRRASGRPSDEERGLIGTSREKIHYLALGDLKNTIGIFKLEVSGVVNAILYLETRECKDRNMSVLYSQWQINL